MEKLKIQILTDNPNSWIVPFSFILKENLEFLGHLVSIHSRHDEITEGDILCILSCENIFKKLNLNKYNLVVHESNLPEGKGWSPLSWQILEGKNIVPITLFEATDKVDAGVIYYQQNIELNGTELIDEIREKQGNATIELIIRFVLHYNRIVGVEQKGASTFYKRRTPNHSLLDIDKTIKEQFNLLRICDNTRYPAYFEINGVKYKIAISKI